MKKIILLTLATCLIFTADALQSTPAEMLYLDIMKKCLLNTIYEDASLYTSHNAKPSIKENRENGLDWPAKAHTMIGLKRLNNIQFCIEDVLKNKVPGDVIETGVWRGGATIFMRAIFKAYGVTDRTVWVADSFEGLPKPNAQTYPADQGDKLHARKELAVSLKEVQANFKRYELLDDQVKFLKGWFKDTLHKAPIQKLAVLRLDGDMYESTMDALNALYDKVSVGGYIIVDDWLLKRAKRAVQDFRQQRNIIDEIRDIDGSSVYWKRGN